MICYAVQGIFTDYGISPREVLERFRQLENTVLVYGNHDRHVINILRERRMDKCSGWKIQMGAL